MPIELEKYRAIRRMSLQGMGIREIARILKVGRNTVRKYKDGATMPTIARTSERQAPVREAIEEDVLRMLKENASLPRKERRTAHDIWTWLVSEKRIAVSEVHVRRIVRELREVAGEEFLPLQHDPGETMQDIPISEYPAVFRFLVYSDTCTLNDERVDKELIS